MTNVQRGVFGATAMPASVSTLRRALRFVAPPPPSTYVSRPRLQARLNLAADARLTVVTGRAGSGKTALLEQWIAGIDESDRSWITLDAGDRDPATFWANIDTAIHGLSGDRLGRFLGVGPARRAYLVVDDCDMLTTQAARGSLVQLVALAPQWLHLVLVGREQPPLALWRLRAAGEVAEITDRDLRLTAGEAAQVVAELGDGRRFNALEALEWHERAEGWITGVALMASSPEGTGKEAIREYLLEEVLAHLGRSVTTFLMETACLSRLSPALCEHITGRPDAADVLQALERANAFVTKDSERHGTYQFHAQFRAVLRDELESRDPDRAAVIHLAAARWYREHADPAASVEQLVSARNVARSEQVVVYNSFGRRGVINRDVSEGYRPRLSPRELEVLSYLPTRLSAREIAQTLYVSRNTLKTHVHNVYQKLDCESRQAAVARARALRLLE